MDRSSTAQGETLTLTYGRHRSLDLTVVCRVLLEPDSPLSKWRISVKNNTSYGIRAIHYPVVHSPLILGESAEDDYFVWARRGGELFPEPGQSLELSKPAFFLPPAFTAHSRPEFRADGGRTWRPAQYPGPVASQLQAYYDGTAGLYLATYDGAGNVKHFGLVRLPDGLDVSIEHNYDERPGLSFDLPYDTVLGVFHGDWYAAADLYKQWAVQQSWCARKTVERKELPGWLLEPRHTLEYECRGDYQRVRGGYVFPPSDYPWGKFWPAKKVIPLTREYASIFGTPVVAWYNGWEKIGNPCGPVDIFPPLEGTESLQAAMAEIRREGHIPFMCVWGLRWCYKRPSDGDDGWARFEREGRPLAALNDSGEENRIIQGNMESVFVPVCIGSDRTQRRWKDWFRKLMDLGAVALEFDLQLGGYPPVCYSDKHGHPPGYGPWMHQKMLAFLREIQRMAHTRDREAILSVEDVCETWIQSNDLMLTRPYHLGRIPLFNYLYHEYIPFLGGDGRNELAHPETELMQQAANFISGNQSWLMVGINDYDFGANRNYPIFSLLRNILRAQRTYAHPYLVFGRMLKPVQVKTATVKVERWLPPGKEVLEPPKVDVPAVMSSVWQSPEGKTGYVLVNWTGSQENVTLELVKKEGAVNLVTAEDQKDVPAEALKSGHVTAVVPARSVLLVEQQ